MENVTPPSHDKGAAPRSGAHRRGPRDPARSKSKTPTPPAPTGGYSPPPPNPDPPEPSPPPPPSPDAPAAGRRLDEAAQQAATASISEEELEQAASWLAGEEEEDGDTIGVAVEATP